jgi:arabinan endo-1,5-alpha-L-arabinosidase
MHALRHGRWLALLSAALLLATSFSALTALPGASPGAVKASHTPPGTYQNPLRPVTPGIGDGIAESCADPSVIHAPEEGKWFMYCTADPLNDTDKSGDDFNFRPIPQFSSTDLVHWTYEGDAFAGVTRPAYIRADAGLWAPEIERYGPDDYKLFYTVTETQTAPTNPAGFGAAIGVASGPSPLGPWTHSDTPVVEPHGADCCGPGSRRATIDPEVLQTAGPDYIYFGSYFGGVSVRVLAEDGLTSVPATQKNVGIANKYEGAEVIFANGFYYLMMSATDCCRGPLTGYSVFVGRSESPTGPFLDREGRDLNDNEPEVDAGTPPRPADNPPVGVPATTETGARAGGSVFLSMNGNQWVGPGHHTMFQDFDGQWWTIYHAIDRTDPYFAGGVDLFGGNCGSEGRPESEQPCGDLNKRPPLLDPVDFSGGFPIVRNGQYISNGLMPAPAAQPGTDTAYNGTAAPSTAHGPLLPPFSDEFNNGTIDPKWTWLGGVAPPAGRGPVEEAHLGTDGVLRWRMQNGDTFVDVDNAAVLVEPVPSFNFMVEVKVKQDTRDENCCFNFEQAGVGVFRNIDNYVKVTHTSIWNTRQTEWAKEIDDATAPQGFPRYGNSVVGPPEGPETDAVAEDPLQNPPGEWTYLRIVRRTSGSDPGAAADPYGGPQRFTAYTSIDGVDWEKGGTWTHRQLSMIGLLSMGITDVASDPNRVQTAWFDYVRVYALDNRGPTGSIKINNGATYTSTRNVTLNISATDPQPDASGVKEMRFRNENTTTWSAWRPYRTTTSWTLSANQGTKRVFAQFRDNAGNIGPQTSDTIILRPVLRVGNVAVREGDGTVYARFPVTLSSAMSRTVTVSFRTRNNTAVAGSDYIARSGTLTFAPGQTRKTVAVAIRGENARERTETFYLDLYNAVNAPIADGRGVGSILDDDPDDPIVVLRMSAPSTTAPGSLVLYTLTYTNLGPFTSRNAYIVDTLPAGTSFDFASGRGVYRPESRTVYWSLGDVAVHDTGTRTLVLRVSSTAAAGTAIVNTADFYGDETTSPTATASTLVGR